MLVSGDIIRIEKHHLLNITGEVPLDPHAPKGISGLFVVVKTSMSGGGMNFDGPYPNGHRVYCEKINDKDIKVDFYQSGCFIVMIEDIEPIGRIELRYQ